MELEVKIPSHKREFQSLVNHFTHSFTQPNIHRADQLLGALSSWPGTVPNTGNNNGPSVQNTFISTYTDQTHAHLGQVYFQDVFGKSGDYSAAPLAGGWEARAVKQASRCIRKQLCRCPLVYR